MPNPDSNCSCCCWEGRPRESVGGGKSIAAPIADHSAGCVCGTHGLVGSNTAHRVGLPGLSATRAGVHRPLMIGGVLGTLIALERAVALSALANAKRHWSHLVPVMSGRGGLLLILSGASVPARVLLMLGSAGLLLVVMVILRRQFALYTAVMALGAGFLLVGNGMWLYGQSIYQAVHWWLGFLILTIVSERLELTRVTRLSTRSQQLFLLATAIFIAGVVLTVLDLNGGKLVSIDARSGNILSLSDISGVPDVVFYNPNLRHLYVAMGDPGVIDLFDTETLAFDARQNKVYAFLPETHCAAVYLDQG